MGDNIDTDVIIPARYLITTEPAELAMQCMEDIYMDFSGNVVHGDIIVAGRNFGGGSSREHAPVAIKASGISCVIAVSFPRIFYRNAINIGLPLIELEGAVEKISASDVLRVDIANGVLENSSASKVFRIQPIPGFIRDIA